MKIKLKTVEIQEYIQAPIVRFPKYTTQLMNLANQNAQGTRPKVVGQLSELIQEFPGKTFEEWVVWYKEKYPDAIDDATDKVVAMIQQLSVVFPQIDRNMVKDWVEDLVLVKTFSGLRFQEAILRKISEMRACDYRLATAYEESLGIDGFVGDVPYSIKPESYRSMPALAESIDAEIVYYEKKKDGVTFEISSL